MKKIAIIGASYLQVPLIETAKKMGIETHVFAWSEGAVGAEISDYFYDISIVEKEKILEICVENNINGICTIASDLAAVTVNYVANEMKLIGNSPISVVNSTNKFKMRQCFEENDDPSPKFIQVKSSEDIKEMKMKYPIIVKPVDRSGSRGVTKVSCEEELLYAINRAIDQGFEKAAIVEEFIEGKEYSVEYLSWDGKHRFLAVTEKYTTGYPYFIETAHLQPANLDNSILEKIMKITEHALDSLDIKYGASHTEIKITDNSEIYLIEIGARMGGDFIGSDLVKLSTGVDFVEKVIEVALGVKPIIEGKIKRVSGVRFIFNHKDLEVLEKIELEHPEIIEHKEIHHITDEKIFDSSTRFGYYLFSADTPTTLMEYLPERIWINGSI